MRERLRQAVDKNNSLEAELEETREKVNKKLKLSSLLWFFALSSLSVIYSLISVKFFFSR